MKKQYGLIILAGLLVLGGLGVGHAGAVIYDFATNPPPDWGNEHGNWKADGGYFAQSPTNNPATYSSLPWVFSDVTVEVEVRDVSDGGIFLRTVWDPVDHRAINGVLLLIGGHSHSGKGFYWHIFNNKVDTGGLNPSGDLFQQGDNIHVKVVVEGNTYKAYCNGHTTPDTTFTYFGVSSGYVGLYDFTGDYYGHHQRFDNFTVVPLPASVFLVGTGFLGWLAIGRWRS